MAVTVYRKTSLIGGLAADLDSVDGALLLDGDLAFVTESAVLYVYVLDDDSGAAEASPNIIAPDVNPGNKRWLLHAYNAGSGTIATDHIGESTATHGVAIDGWTLKDGGAGILTGGANTFSVVNGTASVTADAGVAFHADASAHTSDIIKGDGTAGRVERRLRLLIENGTNASTLKCTTANIWNGDANGVTDNVAKGADTGVFRLNAGGTILTILNTGISGDLVIVLSYELYGNASTTILFPRVEKTADGMQFTLLASATGNSLDITTLVDTGTIYVMATYLTTA